MKAVIQENLLETKRLEAIYGKTILYTWLRRTILRHIVGKLLDFKLKKVFRKSRQRYHDIIETKVMFRFSTAMLYVKRKLNNIFNNPRLQKWAKNCYPEKLTLNI